MPLYRATWLCRWQRILLNQICSRMPIYDEQMYGLFGIGIERMSASFRYFFGTYER